MIALSGLVLATSGAYAAGGIVTGTQTVSDQKIDGKQGNGYFVQSGTLNISNSLLANFTTTGGAGSGGGAGMGGAIFINSGASAVLDTVQFSGNTAVGGKGGVGTVGGSLNNLFNSGASGGSGANGSDAPGGAAAVNGGNGGNGYTGAPGGNASAGVGGTGGRGGDGSSGAAITADTIKAAIDSAYNIATSVEDGSMAAFYSALSTEMAALAASAGPNPMTSALAPTFTALAATFGAEAAGAVPTKVSADMVMAAGDAAYLTAITVTNLEVGVAGNGGSGGNGGKGGVGSTGYGGGQGGKGGNGGDAYGSSMAIGGAAGAGGTGGAGGFGAGGGSGGNGGVAGSDGSSATNDGVKGDGGDGGVAGFGGGDGSAGTGGNTLVGGNGGSGLGGSIFVREGGSLTIKGDTTFSRGKVRGGAGDVSNHGGSGDAAGTDLFMMKGSHVVLDAGTGKTITFNGTIADDSAASIDGYGTAEGDGASLTIKSGLVVFNGENTYTGQTIMAGGVLKAVDGDTLNASSNINFASNRDGGVLLLNSGVFDRYTGTSGERVQWTGSGGFAAIEQDLSVNLSGGLERVWGEEGFMSTPGHALILGSTESTHKVTLENDIDLNGQQGMVLVKANAANDNYGILNGVWHNGSLIVGDSQHTGVLIMTKTNSIDGGTTIAGGELRLQEQGALGDYAPVDVKTGATLDASSTGDQTIGTLTGGGDVKMGGNTLVLNQGSDTTFAGNIQDGGVAGGSAAGIVKNGNGTLRITGNNGYTGTTQINHGAIVLDGTLDSATINIAAGTSLSNNNGGLQSKAVLNNDGLLNQFSDDTIASLVNTGTINGSNTLTAKTYALNDGSVINANLGSGVLTSNDSVQINGRSAAETVNIHSGITTLGAAERLLDSSDVTVDGKLVMGGNEGIGTLAGSGVLELSGSRLTLNHDKTTTYGGVIQDNQNSLGSVQKNGSGTQILTGANTYRGDTVINAGTLALNDGGSLQSQQITIASGGTLDNHNQDNNGLSDTSRVSNAGLILQNSDDTIRTLVNSGTINGDKTLTADSYALNDGSVINANLGSGIVNANGSVAINGRSAAETVNIQSGTTTLGAAERLLDSSNVTVNANLLLGGDETIGTLAGNGSGNVDLNGGKLTLKQNSDTVFAGVIQDSENGSGSLQKDGSGTITLSGASSYTGHTQINSGRVVLDGSLQSHSVTVAQNATLDDNNGGLSPLAALSNDGVINLNADDTVASFSSTGTLNNTGHTLNAASYALNDGSVINANLGAGILTGNGNVLLNGSSQAATVLIASGITTLGAAERLLDSSAVTINGKLVMGGNESIGTLAGNSSGVLELSGSRLILNQSGNTSYAGIIQDSLGNAGSVQKDGNGTLTLGGSNTYRGSTRINSGKLVLDGSLQSQSVSIAQGATLDNQHGGLSATSALNNSGTLNQNADDSVKTLINSGTINGSGTLSADSYTLNNGAVVNANLGAGTLETHGNVTLNGTSQAENVHVYQASVLTLGGENRLNTNADAQVDGKLVLAGGNQTLGSLQGGGTVDITAYKLSVTRGGAFSGTINADSTDLDVSGTRLDLTQGTTTTQSTTVANGTTLSVTQGARLDSDKTTVSQGGTLQLDSSDNLAYKTLTGNGTVNTGSGSFDNKAGSTVKGFLTFSGNYVNNGTLAPGNSPGLTTINGNFVNNGRFESEVQTTTAVSGYDQTRVGGSVILSNSSALVVQTYGGTTPSRGNRYQIIADLSGNAKAVSGAFGSVSFDADGLAGSGVEVNNAAVVFDVATGQVLATGLNSAGSRFADLGNSSSQRAAAAALLKVATSDVGQNQINSATTAGNLAAQLIAANGSSVSANAERFTPEYYGAMADNALRTGELVSGLLQQRVSSALDAATPAGQVSAFSGYLHDKMDAGADTDISRRDFYVGGEYRVSEVFAIGSVLLDGSGDLNARFGSGSSKVRAASLFARLSVNPSLDVLASVHHSSTDYQLSRSTMTGNSSGNTGATALTTSLAAVYRAQISPQLAILPRVGLSHGKASVGSMLEQGSAGDRLDLGGFDAQQTKAQIGATWLWSSLSQGGRWNVALDLGLEHAFSDSHGNMQATLVNDRRVSFPVTFANDSKTLLNVGVSANYAFSKNLSLSAALEGRSNVNGQSGKLGMNYTF